MGDDRPETGVPKRDEKATSKDNQGTGKRIGSSAEAQQPQDVDAQTVRRLRADLVGQALDEGAKIERCVGNHWRIAAPGWKFTFDVTYEPPAKPVDEVWEVGFIQNLIRENERLTYNGGRAIPFVQSTPLLDAIRSPTITGANRRAWVTPTPSFEFLDYSNTKRTISCWGKIAMTKQKAKLSLTMQDYPRSVVCQFFRCGTSGETLLTFERSATFRAWLAARKQDLPWDVASNYRILALTNEFTVTWRAEITATGNPKNIDKDFKLDARASSVEYTVGWQHPVASSPRPVVAGATPNELLGDKLIKEGAAPKDHLCP